MEQAAGTFTEEAEVVITAEKNTDVRYHGGHLLSEIIRGYRVGSRMRRL